MLRFEARKAREHLVSFRDHVILGRTGLHVSRLGVASGYGVPDHAVERAFHEYAINYFYWSAPRFRGGMRSALQRLLRKHDLRSSDFRSRRRDRDRP